MFMNPPFPRPAEPPVKPQYIVLFKGDDSDFEGNQSVDIVIDTELDTTGMKAHFRFMDFVQDFNSIPENKTLSLVFPNAKTSEFPLGAADATLRFEDASGKFRTVSNRIHIVVTNSVHEAYDNEDSQSITVTVKGTVTWDMIEGKPVFADVATSGSYNDLTDKPAIPAPVTVDPALSPTSVNPVQNKVVSKALYTGFTEWECDSIASGYTFVSCVWDDYMGDTGWICTVSVDSSYSLQFYLGNNQEATSLSYASPSIVITRHLITPTKTSQLTNDGAPNGGGTPYATTAQIPDVTGKADKVLGATAGNLASLTAQGNLADSGVKASDFAAKADLPYALVEPGKWEFSGSGVQSGVTYSVEVGDSNPPAFWVYDLKSNGSVIEGVTVEEENPLSLTFEQSGITATRASLPGHLLDRAGNRVVVTGDTTLTLPALVNAGKLRDFLVRLEISGSTVPTITFQGQGSEAPNGADEIIYETDGDTFPVPDEAGTWSYSFTENCVAHKFAVSLKKVIVVTQGGS